MANPFDFKDIAATIQRFTKDSDAFNTGAPTGQRAPALDNTGIGAPTTINVGPAGVGPEFGDAASLLKLSQGLTKATDSKDPATAALTGMAKRAAEARAESNIADQAMSNIFGEPVTAAPAAPPDKFFDLPLDQKLSDVTSSSAWASLPYADKDEYLTLYQKSQRDAFARVLGDAGLKDKDLKEQLKRFDATFTAKRPELLGAKPTFSITDSDWVDGITNMAQKLSAYGDYKAGGSAVAYSEAAKAADDAFQAKKSALTLDEEKASARRNYLQQVANAKTDPTNADLTPAQEVVNAWEDFKTAPIRTALSSTGMSMIAGPLAATAGRIAGGAIGGALGSVVPVAGTAAGAAAGQHVLGTAAASAVEVPFTAQDAIDGALANIRDTPDADLIKSPMMQAEMKANGGDFARAKGALMEYVAREADTRGQLVGGASALADMYLGSGKLAGKAAEAMGSTTLGMSKKGIINSIRQSIGLAPVDDAISRVAADLGTKGTKGAARTVGALGVDAAKEAVVEGTTQYQSNQAVASAGLNINPWEGVASSATLGAIIGPAVGGTTQLGTKALDVVGQKYTGFGSQGVRLKDGEYVIGVDGATGDLTRVRRARDADLANFAADPSTGLMRQIDTESSTPGRTRGVDELISEGMLAYNNNRRVLGAAAMDSLQGDPNAPLVANLFGHMVAATQYGSAADVARSNPTTLKSTGENVQFIFNGNGVINYRGVDGAPVSESAQQEANALIAQAQSLYSTPLRESVSTFFGRTAAPAVAPTNPGGNIVDAGVADGYLYSAPTPTASPAPFTGMNPGQGGLTTQVASSMLTRANISGVNTTDLAAFLDEHNWLNDPKSAESFNTALSAPTSAVQGRGATAVRDLVRAYNANPNAVLAALPAELKPAVQAIAETAPIEDAAFAANVARAPAGGPSVSDASTSNASAEGALTAPSLRAPRGKTTPPAQARIAVMDALTELSSGRSPYASPSQRRLAQALKQIFQTSNIPVPEAALAQLASGVAGDYTPNKHAVRIRTDAAASTFIHELLHAATFRGLERMNELAREGNRKAARTAALIAHIHTAAKQAAQGAGVGNTGNPGAFYALHTYKNMTGAEQYAEMFAELGNPAFIQLLQGVPFESTNPTPELRSIFAELHANTNGTLFDALVSAIRALLRYVSVRSTHAISEATLAEALLTATHEAVSLTDQAYGGTSPTVATNPRTAPAEGATEPTAAEPEPAPVPQPAPAAQEAARVDNSSMEALIPEARRSEAPAPAGGSVGAIRAALAANYGDLASALESKGLLSLVETEAEAVELLVRDLVQAQGVTEAEARETVNRQLRIGSTELDVRAARGGAIEGFFHPATGKSYMVASALTPETAGATLMHEVGVHAANDGSLNPLFARASELLMQPSEDPILREAARRWNAAGETSGEEAMAYIVTVYETTRNVASPTVAQFIQDLIAAIRAWANRTLGVSIDPTPADLAAIARANARSLARSAAVQGESTVAFQRGDALAPLPGYNVSPAVGAAYGPDPELNRVADVYAAKNGVTLTRQSEYAKVDPVKARRIAAAYAAMADAPSDPAVAASYDALIRETRAQYDALTEAGYSFYFIDPNTEEGQRYIASPWTALRELRTEKRMGVFPTESGYGSSGGVSNTNPMLADTGLRWRTPTGDAPVLVNDLFRAVHDAFGHGLEGAGFRADGEENTWRAHATMFSDEALGALTTETRGQNSWLNYGPSGGKNRTASAEDTEFAPQKIGLMPEWTWADARGIARGGAAQGESAVAFQRGDAPRLQAEQEYRDTEARIGGRDAYDRAKADGKTKLNYGQWVTVRTPNFKAWFGDWENDPTNASKVIDPDTGEPLVVYHGTSKDQDFTRFKVGARGAWFTSDVEEASAYAALNDSMGPRYNPESRLYEDRNTASRVMPVFLRVARPYRLTAEEAIRVNTSNYAKAQRELFPAIKAKGYDGILWNDTMLKEWVVLGGPEQVKSATGNTGAFSGASADVRFSRTTAATDAALAGAPATPVRGPSFLNAARTRNPLEAKSKWNALRQRFKAAFVTHLAPVEEAIDAIPDRLNARREQLMADLWLAPNRRDWAKQEAEHRFGGADMTRILGGMANRTKASAETVLRDVGFYHTARYVQIKMAEMAKADQAAAASAARALADAQARNAPRATILKLTNELRAAEKLRDDRAYAYAHGKVGQQEHFGPDGAAAQRALENAEAALAANPNDVAAQKAVDKARAALNSHRVGIPAGMPKAEAEEFIRKMGAKYGVAELEKASKAMNRLMGFRLALDLMSGRTTVGAASAFAPELQALTAQMQAIVNASRAVSTTNPSTRAVLDRALDDFVTRYAAASKYVPTTGAVNEEEEALDVFGQGVRAPNVATDRRLEGRSKGRADSGINAGMAALYRSASDYGWLPFKQGIAALYNEATPAERAALGMNTPVDITVLQRLGDNIIIHGGKGYTFGGDGVMQAIRGENIDGTSDVVKALAAPTFFLAKAMTQWDPTFGPRNAVRDLWERTENVRARKLTDVNGKAVDPNKVANRALRIGANPKFYKEIAAFISGDGRTASSDTARWLKEAMAAGFGGARRLEMLGTDRRTLVEAIEGSNANVRKGMTALGHVVHQWNTAFDSVAPLAIYIAMREAGMTDKQAAYKTLDLMNFRKQGSAMGFVRVLYAFAQPAVTGGHQLIRSASTREGMVRIAAYTVAFAVIKALLAGIAGDDDDLDRKKTDLLDEFTKDRVLAIPMPGGGIAKMPIGYGIPMLGNALAQIGRESQLGLGDKSWTDTAEQFITRALLPQISPIEDSKISTSDSPSGAMVQTFAPTMFAPIIDVAINRSGFGKEIIREEFEDPNRPKSAQGSPFTAGFYQDAAKLIYSMSGGTLDYAPEQVRAIIQGYTPGALGMARKATIDNPNATASGRGVTTPLVDRFYIGDNPNKVIGEIAAFQERGERLLKTISRDLPEDVARGDVVDAVREQLGSIESPSDRATLSLYLDYQDMLEDFKGEARALTASGTPKDPTDPDRAALSLSRNQAQIEVLNRWYQIKGE